MFPATMLLTLACISSATLALNEHEWKEAIAKVYSKLTKEVNEKKVGADFRQLFSDDAEELWPGVHFKKDKGPIMTDKGLRNRHPMAHQNITLRELLYSSSDLAVVRSTDDVQLPDGNETNTNGLEVFVREWNGLKIKLSVFSFE